jgi:hypothetical protein
LRRTRRFGRLVVGRMQDHMRTLPRLCRLQRVSHRRACEPAIRCSGRASTPSAGLASRMSFLQRRRPERSVKSPDLPNRFC